MRRLPASALSATAHRDLPARPGSAPRRGLLGLVAMAWLLHAGPAQALDAPNGKPLLSVSGAITISNAPGRADFDLAMLDALPQHAFTASTPWFKEPRRFSGPLLREVLAAAGANGKMLKAVALNNFKADIPAEDAQKFKVIVATRLDGQPMPLREKGPLFIVYPFDDSAELRQERYYNRSAWQLRALEVK